MNRTKKNQRYVPHENTIEEYAADGVFRRILAYTDGLMCVENSFEQGAVGALHSHPHTQITYIIEGEFEFEIEGEKYTVKKGDSLYKTSDEIHGCVCTKKGVLLDIFTPMREDFIK